MNLILEKVLEMTTDHLNLTKKKFPLFLKKFTSSPQLMPLEQFLLTTVDSLQEEKIKIVAINFPYPYQLLAIYLDSSRGNITGHWYISIYSNFSRLPCTACSNYKSGVHKWAYKTQPPALESSMRNVFCFSSHIFHAKIIYESRD